jgi:hypothetical protein
MVLRFSDSEYDQFEKERKAAAKKAAAKTAPVKRAPVKKKPKLPPVTRCKGGKSLYHLWVGRNEKIVCLVCRDLLPQAKWPDPMGFYLREKNKDVEREIAQ